MHTDDRAHGASSSISLENVKHATLCGLSAAAIKSKLFADQEEREIQRLVATMINHQLKRLELKLKQFAEVETLLLKECEQVERARQRISAGRIQAMRACSNPLETCLPTSGSSTMSPNPMNISPRPLAVPRSMAEATVQAAYPNNMQGQGHPQMPFVQRRPQMLSFGPRLPFSANQTQPLAQAPNIMFSSGAMLGSVTPNHHHQLLRSSSSGNNSTLG
ncbi:unnamed protein product [Triticum turgidum subsp. durum]|uniref:SMARCC C-terminal domain-containing protein n=1 Tax=Triticum turgidum subsp. durum TaxID=4567 RepID=A0A9R0SZ50_TRITD|nr:unnamed protein product [Triticum turgidum subsp. durum]